MSAQDLRRRHRPCSRSSACSATACSARARQALAVGDPAPDKELATLDGGGTGQLADYRGHWVLVNFWASWCEPCRDEAPALQGFHRSAAGDGFTVLGINLDDASDDAMAFVEEFGLTYPQLRDGDGRDRRDAYGMTGLPRVLPGRPGGTDRPDPPRPGRRASSCAQRGRAADRAEEPGIERGGPAARPSSALARSPRSGLGAAAQEPPALPGHRGRGDVPDLRHHPRAVGVAPGRARARADPAADRRGRSKEEIKDALVAEYGPDVLALAG